MTEPINVLIVEDESLIAVFLEYELENAGCRITDSISTGDQAIAIAQQQTPDVVLMDIGLAGEIDGIEAARQIRETTGIPVIFVTGHRDRETFDRASVARPAAYLLKPVSAVELVSTVRAATLGLIKANHS